MPDAGTRHEIELLVDEAGLDLVTTHWPLPSAAVARALDELPVDLPPALDEAREQVRLALRAHAEGRFTVSARHRAEALSGFGDEATPGSSLGVSSGPFESPEFALQVGARLEDDRVGGVDARLRPDDSVAAAELFGMQWQAWAHRSWWGPGWQDSLILGSNAPAFKAVGIQRRWASRSDSRWLAWLGPWNGEVFVAQMEDDMHAYLFGQRITLRPFPQVEIGLTRTAQWGGDGRPQSLQSFLRMFTTLGSNPGTRQQRASDPGNTMAGFDLRARCPGGLRCTVYGQLIGEDEAGLMPSKYLALYGLEHWSADGKQRAFAEFADTRCGAIPTGAPREGCAYRNWAYPQGYADDGRWLGANVGPDSRMLTLGWMNVGTDSALKVHVGHVGSRVGAFSPVTGDPATSGRLLGLSARQGFTWGRSKLTSQLDWMHLDAPDGTHSALRLGVQWEVPLD
jgi:hypothetical protein